MALTLGTDTYVELSTANTYHTNFGNTAWDALSDADKEIALRIATQYLENKYKGRWKGALVTNTQILDWPRSSVWDGEGRLLDSYPGNLEWATSVLALASTTETLIPDIPRENFATKSKLGPLANEYQSPVLNKVFDLVEKLLTDLLSGSADEGTGMERGY